MSRPVRYARLALRDLDGIFEFIARDNPNRASTYVDEIREACRRLGDSPLVGVDRSDIRPGLRILPLWRRLVVAYQIEPDRIRVLRIFSAGRDYEAILRDD